MKARGFLVCISAIFVLSAMGCAPSTPPEQLCGQLIDCYGSGLTLEQKTQATNLCPAALGVSVRRSPWAGIELPGTAIACVGFSSTGWRQVASGRAGVGRAG
ncbi:MAG TPA: hypothetical protein VLM89_08495 [Phycisphaerae bacterium]|nr:hypothetical protein [Phycisphaerae bacterium]